MHNGLLRGPLFSARPLQQQSSNLPSLGEEEVDKCRSKK